MSSKRKFTVITVGCAIAGMALYRVLFPAPGGQIVGSVAHYSDYGVRRPLAGALVRLVRNDTTLNQVQEAACTDREIKHWEAKRAAWTWDKGQDYWANREEQGRLEKAAEAYGDSLAVVAEEKVKAAYRALTVDTTRTGPDGDFSFNVSENLSYRIIVGGSIRGVGFRWIERGYVYDGETVSHHVDDSRARQWSFCDPLVSFSDKITPDVE